MIETPETYERERGKPLPDVNHGVVEVNLGCELSQHKGYRVLVEVDLELNGRRLTPDLSVYPRRPVDWLHDRLRLTEPPLVAVQILTTNQREQDVVDKVEFYLNSGVKTCWVVNPPQHAITIYAADGSQKTYVEGRAVDPATGLTADLEAVFS